MRKVIDRKYDPEAARLVGEAIHHRHSYVPDPNNPNISALAKVVYACRWDGIDSLFSEFTLSGLSNDEAWSHYRTLERLALRYWKIKTPDQLGETVFGTVSVDEKLGKIAIIAEDFRTNWLMEIPDRRRGKLVLVALYGQLEMATHVAGKSRTPINERSLRTLIETLSGDNPIHDPANITFTDVR